MIREILSVLFVVVLYKQLMNEKVLIINPTVKMIKNVISKNIMLTLKIIQRK